MMMMMMMMMMMISDLCFSQFEPLKYKGNTKSMKHVYEVKILYRCLGNIKQFILEKSFILLANHYLLHVDWVLVVWCQISCIYTFMQLVHNRIMWFFPTDCGSTR